jgi:hypothetical protein
MNTHRWIPHVVTQERTVQVEALTGAQRTDPLGQAARRILILALVLGSLGADAAAFAGYISADHANAHQTAGNISLAANVSPIGTGNVSPTSPGNVSPTSPGSIKDPWIY